MSRIVLDTNSLIQCISPRSRYRAIWNSFFNGTHCLCVSNEILNEYEEILERLAGEDTAKYAINLILNNKYTLFVTPYFKFQLIQSDFDDDKFVDCAVASNAKFIITEDRHFDVLLKCDFPKLDIIGLDAFLSTLSHSL